MKSELSPNEFDLRTYFNELFEMNLERAEISINEIYFKVADKKIILNDNEIELIKGLRNFIASQRKFFPQNKNMEEAINDLEAAKKNFISIGEQFNVFKEKATIILSYYKELYEISLGNFNNENFILVKENLQEAKNYLFFKDLEISLAEALSLLDGGLKNLYALEWKMAEIMFTKAGDAFVNIAKNHYNQNEKMYHNCTALGKLYYGMADYFKKQLKFVSFDFQYFSKENIESDVFRESLKYFTKAANINIGEDNELNAQIERNIRMVKGISLISKAYIRIGRIMHSLLISEDNRIELETETLVIQIQTARKLFTEIGETPMVNVTDTLDTQASNISKFINNEKELIELKPKANPILVDLRKLVAKGKIEKIFNDEELFASLLDIADKPKKFNDIISLSSRFHDSNKRFNDGTYTFEQFNPEKIKIVKSFLNLIDSMQ